MLHIQFKYADKTVTWFISPAFIYASLSVSTIFGVFLVQLRRFIKKRKNELKIRGGDKMVVLAASETLECIKSDSPVILKNQLIIETIKKLLRLNPNHRGVIVVDRIVLVLAILFRRQLGQLIKLTILDVSFLKVSIEKGWLMFVIGLTGILSTGTIAWAIPYLLGTQNPFHSLFALVFVPVFYKLAPIIDCDSIFNVLPKASTATAVIQTTQNSNLRGSKPESPLSDDKLRNVIAPSSESFYYVENLDPNDSTIIIKPTESTSIMTRIPEPQECEIIKLDHLEGESIISTFEFADFTGEELIEVLSPQPHYEERCTISKAKYVPLKERTKTLADLKEGDSTKQLEQAETVLKSEPELKKIRQRLIK